MAKVFSADKIYTGESIAYSSAVVIENNLISKIIPLTELPGDVTIAQHVPLLAAAFIDIQIYGASSKLFSVYPSAGTLYAMKEHCEKGGAKYFLPTIATNTTEVIKKGIDAILEFWKDNGPSVPGLHIEGPWINKEKKGAHIEGLIHSPETSEVKDILEYGKGAIKMITLAPEVCPQEIIELIKSYGIIISAGHSNAGYNEAENFLKNFTVATHLFNAMSPLHHRKPGLPAAILMNDTIKASIVADGHHVDFTMIRLAKKLMSERLFFITDAVTETNEGPYPHERNGDKYISNGVLSGSALTMMKAVKNGVEQCGICVEEALRMASLYPAKVLGLDNETGKIKAGYKADLVMMTKELEVIQCI